MPDSSSRKPHVAIITLNWNRNPDTKECVKSLLASDYANIHIVVVDNGSEEENYQDIRSWVTENAIEEATMGAAENLTIGSYHVREIGEAITLPTLSVVRTDENKGFAGGNNIGLEIALNDERVEYFWVLNNDTTVAKDAITHFVDYMENTDGVGIAGGVVCYDHQPEIIQSLNGSSFNYWTGQSVCLGQGEHIDHLDEIAPALLAKCDYVVGACSFVPRRFLMDVGLMEEAFKIYYEEIDWALRAKAKKYILGFSPKSHIYHQQAGTMGKSIQSIPAPIVDFFNVQSRFRFVWKHYPFRLPVYLGYLGVQAVRRLSKGAWRNAFLMLCALIPVTNIDELASEFAATKMKR